MAEFEVPGLTGQAVAPVTGAASAVIEVSGKSLGTGANLPVLPSGL